MREHQWRLNLGQAHERFPEVTFATLGGAMAHALDSRLETPAKFCFAACGMAGFVDDEMATDQSVCMRCVRTLRKRERHE